MGIFIQNTGRKVWKMYHGFSRIKNPIFLRASVDEVVVVSFGVYQFTEEESNIKLNL